MVGGGEFETCCRTSTRNKDDRDLENPYYRTYFPYDQPGAPSILQYEEPVQPQQAPVRDHEAPIRADDEQSNPSDKPETTIPEDPEKPTKPYKPSPKSNFKSEAGQDSSVNQEDSVSQEDPSNVVNLSPSLFPTNLNYGIVAGSEPFPSPTGSNSESQAPELSTESNGHNQILVSDNTESDCSIIDCDPLPSLGADLDINNSIET